MRDDTASRTALVVAVGLLVLTGDAYGRRKCPSDPHQTVLAQVLRHSGVLRLPTKWIQNFFVAKMVRWLLWLVHENMLEGLALRKTFMEAHVRSRLNDKKNANACRQVLIVAAGYDTLALRLSKEYPRVQFFEVDHPATQAHKLRALHALGKPSNVHAVAADLSKVSLQEALLSKNSKEILPHCYDKDAPTVVVVEGLLMYLTPDQVKALFCDIGKVVGKSQHHYHHYSSSVCFDFFGWNDKTDWVDVGWAAPLLRWGLTRAGEPWRWGVEPSRLQEFLKDTPWKVLRAQDELQREGLGLERLAVVDYYGES